MLDLTFTDVTKSEIGEAFFSDIIEKSIKYLDIQEDVEIGVHLIDIEEIQTLNKRHRNKDKPTDVLSFPIGEKYETENGSKLVLGDIFISTEVAKLKAKSENISIDHEFAWLVVHGLLHLLGYDHEISEEKATEMSDLEQSILNTLNII